MGTFSFQLCTLSSGFHFSKLFFFSIFELFNVSHFWFNRMNEWNELDIFRFFCFISFYVLLNRKKSTPFFDGAIPSNSVIILWTEIKTKTENNTKTQYYVYEALHMRCWVNRFGSWTVLHAQRGTIESEETQTQRKEMKMKIKKHTHTRTHSSKLLWIKLI